MNSSAAKIVKGIELNLRKPLPGYEVQKRMEPSVRADLLGNTTPNLSTRESAVMILLYPFGQGLNFVLIKRQTYDGPHSGQVSLPGGKFDESDASIEVTALRETYEEVGVEPNEITILGKLTELFIPISNLLVQPFVGYIAHKPQFTPNLQEVEYIIEVDVAHLLDDSKKSVKVINSHGWPTTAPFYSFQNEMVWGATAMILSEFEEVLKWILKE